MRTVLNEIQNLIEKGNGATESELKTLWNQLSDAITQSEQLNLPPVVGRSEQLPPNLITDGEHKDLMKALYPKDNSKRFRR